MRSLIQRVEKASVIVNKKTVGSISNGFLVFFALHKDDTINQIPLMAKKIVNFRIFPDEMDKLNLSLLDVKGQILIVSQFTLYADTKKGRRPSFIDSMNPEEAEKIYEEFVLEIKKYVPNVQTGIFGAKMKVHLINDGPLTFLIEV